MLILLMQEDVLVEGRLIRGYIDRLFSMLTIGYVDGMGCVLVEIVLITP